MEKVEELRIDDVVEKYMKLDSEKKMFVLGYMEGVLSNKKELSYKGGDNNSNAELIKN